MKHLLTYLLMPLILFCQGGCFRQYYQTNTSRTVNIDTLAKLNAENKFFIVHTPDSIFGLREVTVGKDALTGEQDTLNRNFEKYLYPKSEMGNPVRRSQVSVVIEEVHLYTRGAIIENGQVSIPVNRIERMDVYGKDIKAIRRSRIIGITVTTIIVAASAALIVGFIETGFFIY
jgi:hypothetical protein